MEYSREALGRAIKAHRDAKGLNQQQLGELAGYKAGAAVSISRVETGRVRPGEARLTDIAAALGLTLTELESQAAERTRETERSTVAPAGQTAMLAGSDQDLTNWCERLKEEACRRDEVHSQVVDAFTDAYERSHDQFFMSLLEVASNIEGSDLPADLPRLSEPTTGAAEQAAYALRLASGDVTTGGSVGTSVGVSVTPVLMALRYGPDAGRLAAVAATRGVMRWGKAGTGTPNAELRGAALYSAAMAWFGGGPKAAGGRGIVGGEHRLNGFEAAVGLGIPFVVMLASLGVRIAAARRQSAAQRAELVAALQEAEATSNTMRRGYEATAEILPRATAVLDDIAVHGTRALNRWAAQLGPFPWDTLAAADEQRYRDFLEIFDQGVALGTISVDELLESTGQDQEDLIASYDELVNQAEATVERLV